MSLGPRHKKNNFNLAKEIMQGCNSILDDIPWKEEQMSLRQKIEALNNGWDKEADDILHEICKKDGGYSLQIWCNNKSNGCTLGAGIRIRAGGGEGNIVIEFEYGSQCQKMQAFKDALLWLLDKSGLDSPKQNDLAKVEVGGQIWEAKLVKKL